MAILSNFQANAREALKVSAPVQSGSLTYDGNAKSPTWTEYPTSAITIGTITPQVNAGTYYATATLKSGCVWSDTLRNEPRQLPWTIGKASGGTIVLSKNAVEIGEDESDTVTATLTGTGGTLSAVSSDTDVATASVSGNTITITDGGTEGIATITVSADGNYMYTSVTIGVEVSYGPVIVTWANGTDAQIVAMCEASDQGILNLWDYWNIGDERTVHLSAMAATGVGESHVAQDVTMVLMNKGGKSLSNGLMCAFVVGQKNVLKNKGYISANVVYSWEDTDRRQWCNNIYYYAIPSSLRSIFKQHINRNCIASSGNPLGNNTVDLIALHSRTEIYGVDLFNDINQGYQLKYYETTANRIKSNATGTTEWWTRSSSYYSSSVYWCSIKTNGSLNSSSRRQNSTYGIAPFGCIGSINDGLGTLIPSWESGTDAQIVDIISKADAGQIDLTNYWNIGDRRTVSLSAMNATGVGESHVAQDVIMILVASDTHVADSTNPCYNYQYVTSKSGRTYPSFIVHQEKVLMYSSSYERGYMNSTNTTSGGWKSCARRTWCNNVYKNAIPSTLTPIIKQVKVFYTQTNTSSDYVFLLSSDDLSTFQYYYSSTYDAYIPRTLNEKKDNWWLRTTVTSPKFDYWSCSNVGIYNANASATYSIAPAFCI